MYHIAVAHTVLGRVDVGRSACSVASFTQVFGPLLVLVAPCSSLQPQAASYQDGLAVGAVTPLTELYNYGLSKIGR